MVTRWSGFDYREDLDGDMVEYSDYRVLMADYKKYFEDYATLAAAARRLVEAKKWLGQVYETRRWLATLIICDEYYENYLKADSEIEEETRCTEKYIRGCFAEVEALLATQDD